jgi:hypothetical protein
MQTAALTRPLVQPVRAPRTATIQRRLVITAGEGGRQVKFGHIREPMWDRTTLDIVHAVVQWLSGSVEALAQQHIAGSLPVVQ